jgi:hypothetical protein
MRGLSDQLVVLIAKHGPRSGRWLRDELGVRKTTLYSALHTGQFVQVGRGRAAKWDVVPVPPEIERYRAEVWKARSRGVIDGVEALELLLDPKPRVLEMLAEVVA